MVRFGLGVAMIAPTSAPALHDVITMRPKPAPSFVVSLVLPDNRPLKPAAHALADADADADAHAILAGYR